MDSEDFYFSAESENGRTIPDPSEDAIYMLLEGLDLSDNTFLTLEPTDASEGWYVSIAKQSEDEYEVEFRDALTREHEITVKGDKGRIAKEATLWVAGRPAVARRRAL